MALTAVTVTGRYLTADRKRAFDNFDLSALPPVVLPGEFGLNPVDARLAGGGQFRITLFSDTTNLTYAVTERVGSATRSLSIVVPANATGELSLAALSGYSQPAATAVLGDRDERAMGEAKIGFFGVAPVVKPTALTAVVATAVAATYGATEQGVLSNVRTRLNEVEAKLRALGLLA